MTLHVPHGLLITGDLANPFRLSATLRPLARQVAVDLWYALLGQAVAAHVDATRAGVTGPLAEHTGTYDIACAAATDLHPQVMNATADLVRRNPEFDLGFCVRILAHPDRDDALLAIVATEHQEYLDAVNGLHGVSEYGWWSCEHPPAPDWDTRHGVWTAALRNGRSSDEAWSWSLFGAHVALSVPELDKRPDLGRVVAAVPDAGARAQRLASAMTTLPRELLEARDFSGIMTALREGTEANLPAATASLRPITTDDLAW